MKRMKNVFQCDVAPKARIRAITRSWIVASCDVDELSAARSRRLAKYRRRKCRRWFRSLLLYENSYTYEEYEVEEAEKVLGALRRATHFHNKFLNCTCNKLIRLLIIRVKAISDLSKSSLFHLLGFFHQLEANLSLTERLFLSHQRLKSSGFSATKF